MKKGKAAIFGCVKLYLLIHPFLCIGNVTTVADREELRIELLLSYVFMANETAANSGDLIALLVEHVK